MVGEVGGDEEREPRLCRVVAPLNVAWCRGWQCALCSLFLFLCLFFGLRVYLWFCLGLHIAFMSLTHLIFPLGFWTYGIWLQQLLKYPCLLILSSVSFLGWLWFVFSCFLACLVIFDWMPRHCDFYLVGCWVFLYFYKYSWPLFWNVVKLLRNSLILWVWLLGFVRWDQSYVESSVVTLPHHWGKSLLSTLSSAPKLGNFPLWLGERVTLLGPPWTRRVFLLIPGLDAFLTRLHWSVPGWSQQILSAVCDSVPSSALPVDSSALAFLDSQCCFFTSGDCWTPPGVSAVTQNYLSGRKLGS